MFCSLFFAEERRTQIFVTHYSVNAYVLFVIATTRSYIDAGRRWAMTAQGELWKRSRGVAAVPDKAGTFVMDLCEAQGHSIEQQVPFYAHLYLWI